MKLKAHGTLRTPAGESVDYTEAIVVAGLLWPGFQ